MKHTIFTPLLITFALLSSMVANATVTTISKVTQLTDKVITVKKGDTLKVTSTYVLESCKLTNNGTILIGAAGRFCLGKGTLAYNNGTIKNTGTMVVGTSATAVGAKCDTLFNNNIFDNNGNFAINVHGCLVNERNFTNNGTVTSKEGMYIEGEGVFFQNGKLKCVHSEQDPRSGYCPLCDGLILNVENFPDSTFRAYVKKSFEDTINAVQKAKVEAFDNIEQVETGVKTFEGLEYFTGLRFFETEEQLIEEIDFSNNKKLVAFYIYDCVDLKEINGLTSCVELEEFRMAGTKVHTLDLSKCSLLKDFEAEKNQFDSLDLRKNPNVVYFTIADNQLVYLNVSKCTKLTSIEVSGNNLKKLDVSGCKSLVDLTCSYNNISSLNVKKNTNLSHLDCRNNQLVSLDLSSNTKLKYLYSEKNVRELPLFPCRFTFSQLDATIADSLVSNVKGAKFVKKSGGNSYYVPTDTIITYTYDVKTPSSIKLDSVNKVFTLKSQNVKKHVYDMHGNCTYCDYHCEHKKIKNGFCTICKIFTEEVETFDVTLSDIPWMDDSVHGGKYSATINGKYPFEVKGMYVNTKDSSQACTTLGMAYILAALSDKADAFDILLESYVVPARKDSLYWSALFQLQGITEDTKFTVNGSEIDYHTDYDNATCLLNMSKAIDPIIVESIAIEASLPVLGTEVQPALYPAIINDSIKTTVAGLWTDEDGKTFTGMVGLAYVFGKIGNTLPADGSIDSMLLSLKGAEVAADSISLVIATNHKGLWNECKVTINGVDADYVYSDSANAFMVAYAKISPVVTSVEIAELDPLKEYQTYAPELHDVVINGTSKISAYGAWVKGSAGDAVDLAYVNYQQESLMDPTVTYNSSLQTMESVKYLPQDSLSFVMLLSLPGCSDTTKVTFADGKVPSLVQFDVELGVLEVVNYYPASNGVNDAPIASLSVAPNPAVDCVQISCEKGQSVSIVDMTGKQLMNMPMMSGETSLNVSHLVAGVYVVVIRLTDGSEVLSKLIKE